MYLCNHVQFTCTAVILHIKDICCGVQKGPLNALTSSVNYLSEEHSRHIFGLENILIINS